MGIPISRKLRNLDLKGTELNPGLFYGKFAQWEPDESEKKKKGENKDAHVSRLISLGGWCAETRKLADYLHKGAQSFHMITETRLLIGRGTPSVFEQGISLHPLFGLPFLPGSAIKGATAHWAAANGEDGALREQIFGPPTENEEKAQGKVVFLDAVPLERQCLEKEVMVPHYHDYYSDEKKRIFPSDTESPQVFFLPAVKRDIKFQFALQLTVAAEREKHLMVTARQWIEAALQEFGIGSKTGSNYGYFRKEEN